MSKRVILSAMGAVVALLFASAGSANAATPAVNVENPNATAQVTKVRWWRRHYYAYPGYYGYPGYAPGYAYGGAYPYYGYGYRRYAWGGSGVGVGGPGFGVYVGPRRYWW
jgi:hypothetical protein